MTEETQAQHKPVAIETLGGGVMPELFAHERGTIGGIVADPPYSSGGAFRADRANRSTQEKYQSTGKLEYLPDFSGDNRDQRAFILWAHLWMSLALDRAISGAPLLVFTDWRQLPTVTDAVQVAGWNWQGLFVWNKVNGRPHRNRARGTVEYVVHAVAGQVPTEGEHYPPSIIRAKPPAGKDRQHPTEKPVAALDPLVRLCRPDGVVLDPFMGAGSTLVAAKAAGLRAVGIEHVEHFCQVAADRCRQTTLLEAMQAPSVTQDALELGGQADGTDGRGEGT